ncbi:MAG TPA: hypothetical protein VMI11_06230 [Actinomycetes bacterium]|nr:hypothetical protein [Actinomycetes bacterium]
MTDQAGAEEPDAEPSPPPPPSWSPEQPPAGGGSYAVPPGGSATPPPPRPAEDATPQYATPPPPPGAVPPPSPGQYPGYVAPYPPSPYGYAAPKPGIIPLRPLVFSEILDGAVQAIRSNPRMLLWASVGVVAILVGTGVIFGAGFALSSRSSGPVAQNTLLLAGNLVSSLGQLVLDLVTVCAQTLLGGLVVVSVSESVLGRQATFAQTWSRVRPRFWRLLGYTLLSSLGIALGILCCVLPGLALQALWALGAPALVLEGIGIRKAFGRSTSLVSGSFWRVVGILIVTSLLTALVTFVVAIVFAAAGGLLGAVFGGTAALVGALVVGGIGLVAAMVVTATFSASVTALLYIDLRMRREGLDIALARAVGATPRM